MQIREQLEQLIDAAVAAACEDGSLELEEAPAAALERPRDESNGDWASTVAMRSAKQAKKNPREIAQIIVDHLPENGIIASAEIAGPGFINFRLSSTVLQGVVSQVREEKEGFGHGFIPEGQRYINLEYISANPTGPMHVGHGRWAALGDATARVMRHAGYDVYEEFYINDAGTQMDNFGESVAVRYQQILGRDVEMPEACYAGSYVNDIAQVIIDEDGDVWLDADPQERMENFRERAYQMMLAEQHRVTGRFGTTFDCWFSERSLYVKDESGESAVDRSLKAMSEKGYIYEQDGATWFKSSAFDDEKDRVLIKANGEYTYFMSDVAYHYNKLERGFDHLINIWGADHHGYIARCEAMLAAWGRPGALEIMLGQLVNLFRDGEAVRMSKRTGEMITFEELIDEVGVDATRYLMLSRSSDQPIDFDIEVAKKKDASNPVYYVQYAHARICSILRKAADAADAAAAEAGELSMDELAAKVVPAGVDLSPLTHESELALMRKMDDFADLVSQAARDRAAFRLTHYAQDLAALFHSFYTNCHIIGEDEAVQNARLALADATRIVLATTLGLLGVSAPAKM
ncbi:arginine--tRNA ligase [Paraeggerthella hongkongensis]|uniref:arginine--tRNA ligase n=3 Tax=Eggerthellaceae TaxID=1643826 RepID=UPI000DF7629A|nr:MULTISPECIES: arginine--tRNA ligase [Paraeggerthella]MBU5406285.1 arginine--tRNA ligase [Paraeggerthella hongkongensis]MCD2434135.1 arginine--tRNA ligase [Paraeggerthella hominis]RDB54533.1 arginine--tRNA ligase [Paraeggerthella hongkongensis]